MKTGLDYFSLDTDFFSDRNIMALGDELGSKATVVFIKILCDVYRKDGYFLKWDSYYSFDIARIFEKQGIKENLINEVIGFCFKRKLFDLDLFKRYSIITSRSIQERYFRSKTSTLKRKASIDEFIRPEISLLKSLETNCGDFPTLSEISPKIPDKESILKGNIGNDNNIPPISPKGETSKKFVKPSVSEIDDYAKSYLQEKGYLVSFNAESFFDFYESKGWFVGKNKMKDWKASVRNWINGDNKNQSYTPKSSKKADFASYDFSKNPLDF